MKICAIICEYNPFHNGHQYQIDTLKQKYGIDKVIGIMSGNFVQRGFPSIMDKYTRAKIAVECGCDLVVGIPTPYTLASAEIFAMAGVKIASAIQGVTHISFGCETQNISVLYKLADYLSRPNETFNTTYKNYIQNGDSHPISLTKTLVDMIKIGEINFATEKEIIDIVSMPNNILALEYLKQIKHTSLTPIILQRTSNYHSGKVTNNTSAKAIRQFYLSHNTLLPIKKSMPQKSFVELKNYAKECGKVDYDTFCKLLLSNIKLSSVNNIKNIFDVEQGLENRIITCAQNTNNFEKFFSALATKRYTNSRLQRILLCHLLQISKDMTLSIKNDDFYIKVLAIKNTDILKDISGTKNLVVRAKDADKINSNFVDIEDRANQLYSMLLKNADKFLSRINKDIYSIPFIEK